MDIIAPSLIGTVLSFLLLLTVLVFVHELGHFSVARYFGVKVDTFSIGFGREIIGRNDKYGTRWKLCWIPFGGYVKFFGDADATSQPGNNLPNMTKPEKAVAFHYKPLYQKAAIVAAGPIVNFIFAILVFIGLFTSLGEPYTTSQVSGVQDGGAAFEAGIEAGDHVIRLNGNPIDRFDDLQRVIGINMGEPVLFSILRNGEEIEFSIIPTLQKSRDAFGNEFDVRRIGIQSGPIEIAKLNIYDALVRSVQKTGELVNLMLVTTGQVITGARPVDEMGGPIKIAQYSGQQASLGIISFISFMALISINLGLVNLFPIPMLDGGHLLFYGIEAIKGSPVSKRVQEIAYMAGFLMVISLMVFLTWNDLSSS